MLRKKVFAHNHEQKEFVEWNRYLDLNALPPAFSPPALREYLYKWQLNDQLELDKSYDPQLSLDERSILTQDLSKKDQTVRTFKIKRPSIGDPYMKRIGELNRIMHELKYLLESNEIKLKPQVRTDLQNLQIYIRKTLYEFIDRWTYGVLSNIDRDMT